MAADGELTIDEGLKTISLMCEDGSVTEQTGKKYAEILAGFLLYTGHPFIKTQPTDVKNYRENLADHDYRTSTIRRNLATLHSVFEHLLERKRLLSIPEDTVLENPFTRFLLKDESDEVDPRNVASVENVQKLLADNIDDTTLSCAVLVCLKLLLHVRELAVLRADDVFPSKYEGKDILALHVGKGATERDMIVPSDLAPFLRQVRDSARECVRNTEGWLFFNEGTGKGLTAETLRMRLYRAVQKSELSGSVNFNSIRNLGIALCRAPEDVLFTHLSFADDRHNRRVAVLRKMGDRVCSAGESVDVTVRMVD